MIRIIALVAIVFLSACNGSDESDPDATKSEAVHNVRYYIDHPDERDAMMAKCKNNPGELRENANCRNAGEADRRAFIDEIMDATSATD